MGNDDWTIDKLKPGYMIVWTDDTWSPSIHDSASLTKVGIILSNDRILCSNGIYFQEAAMHRDLLPNVSYYKTICGNQQVIIRKSIKRKPSGAYFQITQEGENYVVIGVDW